MIQVKNIEDVVNYQLCTGCGVCAAAEPQRYEMHDAIDFGYRPKIRSHAVAETGEAFSLCPGHKLEHDYDTTNPALVKSLEDCWGPVFGVWEGFAADQDIRYRGSSGGFATALSLFALEQKGVEAVIHTGSSKAPPETMTKLSSTKAELLENSGSRYSPASPCTALSGLENKKGSFVFVGKPCDVAAVSNWQKKSDLHRDKIALRIGFFCAGTPSTAGNLELLKQQGLTHGKSLKSLKFRGEGWPGMWRAVFKSDTDVESKSELTYAESWGFLQRFRQWRCYICPDHSGEFADISVGDPWYRKVEMDEPGKSLIVVRTQRGMEFLREAEKANYIVLEKQDNSLLPRSQPNLVKSRGDLWARLLVLRLMRAKVPNFKGFKFFKFWWSALSVKNKIGSIIGTAKRVSRKGLKNNQHIID